MTAKEIKKIEREAADLADLIRRGAYRRTHAKPHYYQCVDCGLDMGCLFNERNGRYEYSHSFHVGAIAREILSEGDTV